MQVSVIINNHNYGRFLRPAIDSALDQGEPAEVVVVDDGSSDDSRAIIASYGTSVVPVYKDNGGQASAFNAGFSASTGEAIIFLDADDTLKRTAVETARRLLRDPSVVKAHWPLLAIDAAGLENGRVICPSPPAGDCRRKVQREGVAAVVSPPTSGNAWRRTFLARVLPIPESDFRLCADGYLFTAAAALGPLAATDEPHSCYRLHGQNGYWGYLTEAKLAREIGRVELLFDALSRWVPASDVDRRRWRQASFTHRMARAIGAIVTIAPPETTVVLVDQDEWALRGDFAGRAWLPFCEQGGYYNGMPSDGVTAVQELERLRGLGAVFFAVPWLSFWCLAHYEELSSHLANQYKRVLETTDVIVYDMR